MSRMDKELESRLWAAADSLRGNISSEQYMHVVIGILFLKYISDKYDQAVIEIKEKHPKNWNNLVDDRDFLDTFIVPKKSKWSYISQFSSSQEIGEVIDKAFMEIERANDNLKGLFDKNYNREELDQNKLGQVIAEFSDLNILKNEDIIGRIYEYFLGEFFKKQGQKGGEFYTPKSITTLLVDIIDPQEGLLYDPACGTGGMFIQSKQHLLDANKKFTKLVIYGQEYQNKTWKLARINLLIHGFHPGNIHLGNKSADTFSNDQHKNIENFDYVLANPPFNQKKWGLEKLMEDSRWKWGLPPKNNANYAWISHMLSKLKDSGRAGIVLANGSLSASGKTEMAFRKNLLESNTVDAIIALPDKLFYTTGIPACLWILNNKKKTNKVLMVNASEMPGNMISKKLREITSEENAKILDAYHKHASGETVEVIGFAKTVELKELVENDYSFVPGRYVGFEEEKIDRVAVKKEIKEAAKELKQLFGEFQKLAPQVEAAIEKALKFEEEND